MRILLLTTTPRTPDNRPLWEALRAHAEVDLHFVPKDRQADLRPLLAPAQVAGYDRVVLDLLFRHVSRQVGLLRSIPGLVLYEEDACQEFIPSSKWRGKFSAFYRQVPHARVVFTGFRTSQAFAGMGVDACFLPKGYAAAGLYPTGFARTIELGFVGRVASSAYDERRVFLERAAQECGVQLLRTEPGNDYRDTLNRIRIFVSADLGLGEYMAKNFEAMACGCVLLAHRQGAGEEEALGLVDGENVLLYEDVEDFRAKLAQAHAMPASALEDIAARGMALVSKRCEYAGQSRQFFSYLQDPIRPLPPASPGLFGSLWRRIRSGAA